MNRRDRGLPATPFSVDGPFLAAILGALDDLHDLLDSRLPACNGEPVKVAEPAPDSAPAAVPQTPVPVKDPAPGGPGVVPDNDADPRPTLVDEPAPAPPGAPPRAGRGSSLAAWQEFASAAGVAYVDDATRDDIIAACEAAGVIEAK